MMRDGKIFNDTNATIMDAQRLAELPAPVSLGPRHRPIPYINVATGLVDAAERAGLRVKNTQWAVGKYRNVLNYEGQIVRVDNAEMVGLVSVEGGGLPELKDADWQIAYQGGQAEHLAQRLMAGKNMFVCTNLALMGGEVVMKKKSTTGLFDLDELFDEAILRFLDQTSQIDADERVLHDCLLDDTRAYELAAKAVMQNVVPAKSLKPILTNWHAAEKQPVDMADCHERSQYGLYNCFTRSIRDQHLMQQTANSAKIGRYFGVAA
jgi:hypothetical protein